MSEETIMSDITIKCVSNNCELDVSESLYDVMDDILCDNPFGYEHNFVLYYNEGECIKCNDIIELLGLCEEANVSLDNEVILNGCSTILRHVMAFVVFVESDKAQWMEHTKEDYVYAPLEDTEPYGVIDNTNDDSYDGSF